MGFVTPELKMSEVFTEIILDVYTFNISYEFFSNFEFLSLYGFLYCICSARHWGNSKTKVGNNSYKRGLSCAKLSQQSTSFLGPMELFFWFELLMVVLLNCWIVELLIC